MVFPVCIWWAVLAHRTADRIIKLTFRCVVRAEIVVVQYPVTIDVVVTSIAFSVTIKVVLVRIRHIRAVVLIIQAFRAFRVRAFRVRPFRFPFQLEYLQFLIEYAWCAYLSQARHLNVLTVYLQMDSGQS